MQQQQRLPVTAENHYMPLLATCVTTKAPNIVALYKHGCTLG